MNSLIFSNPWDKFCGVPGAQIGASRNIEVTVGAGLRLYLDHHQSEKFRWNGSGLSEPVSHSSGDMSFTTLPMPDSGREQHASKYSLENINDGDLKVCGLPVRARVKDRDSDLRERWILWQNQRYKELTHPEDFGELDIEFHSGVRRGWESVKTAWKSGGEDQAEMSLIVELSRNLKLKSSLVRISSNPRKMLERLHASQKLSKIREFDSHSLREYARAPGRNLAEKGGAKQELIAVINEETADLSENRVTLWTVRRMYEMAVSYIERNKFFLRKTRVKRVAQFRDVCKECVVSMEELDVSFLPHHLDSPTYCLQFESRYQHVWSAYKKIRKQDQEVDDSWKWQNSLWGNSSRLILGSLFQEIEGWAEVAESTAYFRKESIQGEWLIGPYVPGPFETQQGSCHIVDLKTDFGKSQIRDFELPLEVFESGCDWILVWPSVHRICLVWSGIAESSQGDLEGYSILNDRLLSLSSGSYWKWSSVILLAEPCVGSAQSEWIDSGDHYVVLRIPEKIYENWEDLKAGLDLALEKVHGS